MREIANAEKAAAAPVKKHACLKCVSQWVPFEHKRMGCGKYYTADSVLSECPDCGRPLSVVRLDEPVYDPVPRIHKERCVKCMGNIYAEACYPNIDSESKKCKGCPCRQCCAEASALYDRWANGEVTLGELVREAIRERMEAKAKAGGATIGAEVAKKSEPQPGDKFKSIGAIFEDEIPF
jgi:hypothetical protein